MSMVVNPSLVSATAPNQPTAAEGGKFQEDLRFAGDYRERVAFQLVDEYMKDGMGAAEISLPIAYNAPFGSTNEVAVRYPVSPRHSIRNGAIFLDPNGPSRTRCVVIRLYKGVSSLGQAQMSIGRQKIDPETCGRTLTFEPFVELDRMVEKTRQCQARGDKDCVLYTNITKNKRDGKSFEAIRTSTMSGVAAP